MKTEKFKKVVEIIKGILEIVHLAVKILVSIFL
ncbi:hypothetical protein BXY58_0612 [Epilithonimonas arachidiradicis]|uniref:Uncharacterized protein n=1 Tax=Epilithonimonas arachidiradicis TaxID=1617282 RepID=A0A420DEG1_9FLAO|nr:hypothetical protein BXY58_0612 [Epilithonimonas arachidiradicis]